MAQTLETIAARLQMLEDIEEIRQRVASYGILADCRESASLSQLWTPDGQYEVGGLPRRVGVTGLPP